MADPTRCRGAALTAFALAGDRERRRAETATPEAPAADLAFDEAETLAWRRASALAQLARRLP